MKKILAVTLAVVFILAFAAPVFAQSMTHYAEYKMDGSIDIEKQVGHLCNTGAEAKQTIKGEGEMTKVMDVTMEQYIVTVSDHMDWITAEDAVQNLAVISAIELCAPPKFVYEGAVVSPAAMYNIDRQPYTYYGVVGELLVGDPFGGTVALADVDPNFAEWEPVSKQIWAAHVSADPGFSGNLHQDYQAAYGPYAGIETDPEATFPGADDSDRWGWQLNERGVPEVALGVDYVGNYFTIDQMARTSMGTVQRYIDISSPWSHAYLYEDMTVVGMTEVDESFAMANLPAGEEAVPEWWELF